MDLRANAPREHIRNRVGASPSFGFHCELASLADSKRVYPAHYAVFLSRQNLFEFAECN